MTDTIAVRVDETRQTTSWLATMGMSLQELGSAFAHTRGADSAIAAAFDVELDRTCRVAIGAVDDAITMAARAHENVQATIADLLQTDAVGTEQFSSALRGIHESPGSALVREAMR